MADYSHFIGYLHSEELRWSYGGVRGRPESSWQQTLADLPTAELIDVAAAFGFGGVYVDRFAYEDRGAELESVLIGATVTPPLVSADGRHSFFVLDDPALVAIRQLPREERSDLTIAAIGTAPPA
jgi:phosphoglycerol transferase